MSLSSMLTDTCTRRRRPGGKSTATGGPTSGKPVDVCFRCAIQAGGGQDSRQRGTRGFGQTAYTGYFEYGVDITTADLIIWRDLTLQVIGGPFDRAGRKNHAEYALEETRPNA